nr:putative ORF1 [Marmot picobirnavirus]
MTTNQIQYLQARETERHNREMEKYYHGTLGENRRHSMATEAETARHNFGDESIRARANDINYFAAEQQALHALRSDRETNRSNLVREGETARTNLANEKIRDKQAIAALQQAGASWYQAQTARDKLSIDLMNAKSAWSQAESKKSEVSNSNLLRDSQRVGNLATLNPNLDRVVSETELNRSRAIESQWRSQQQELDYFYTPIDRITNVQNAIGKGASIALGRSDLNAKNKENATAGQTQPKRSQRQTEEQAWQDRFWDAILK